MMTTRFCRTVPAALHATAFALLAATALPSCKKDERKPPVMELVSGAAYVSSDATLSQSQAFVVRVKVTKTEDELRTLNISRAYDGASASTTVQNITLDKSEEDGFTRDVPLSTRAQAGTERYVFTATDRDGNTATQSLTLTVQ